MVSDLQYHALNPRHHIGLHRAQGKGVRNPHALLTTHVELHWMLAPEMLAFARELHPHHYLHLWTPGMPLLILTLRHQSKGNLQTWCFPALEVAFMHRPAPHYALSHSHWDSSSDIVSIKPLIHLVVFLLLRFYVCVCTCIWLYMCARMCEWICK